VPAVFLAGRCRHTHAFYFTNVVNTEQIRLTVRSQKIIDIYCMFFARSVSVPLTVSLIMATLRSRCGHSILSVWFLLSFLAYSSGRRLDVYHILNAGLKYAARGSLKIQDAKKSPKIRHLHTIAQCCPAISSQLRHVSAIRKELVKQQFSSTCSCNMVNFGPLAS